MKVIQLLPELNAGGVERGTLELGEYLVGLGHESMVISGGGRMVDELVEGGSQHVEMEVGRKRLGSLKLVPKLRRLFEEERPDIIHVRSRVPAWLVWLAWRKMNPKTRPRLISTVHGFYSVNRYSKIMTCGERVICVSESVREYVLQNYPDVDSKKLTVIHRGVAERPAGVSSLPSPEWLDRWHEDQPQLEGRHVVTLPGRLTRWKGALDFVEVVRTLRDRGLPVHGLIVGSPHPRKLAFRDEVRDAVRLAGLEERVTLLGHRTDLLEIMAVSGAVVSCSTDPEAFGRVTLEALSIGRPVAAYGHGGVGEQLQALLPEGLVPLGDVAAMADLLARWYENPPKPREDNPFTLERMVSSIVKVYDEVLEGGS